MELEGSQSIIDNKLSMKLYPHHLSFEVGKPGEEEYFFISEKGVFKWKPGMQ